MKNKLYFLVLCPFFLFSFNGCSKLDYSKYNTQTADHNRTNAIISDTSKNSSNEHNNTYEIDLKQAETTVRNYFEALEKKDYSTAWSLTSTESQKNYPKSKALKNHWGIKSIKFKSMEKYSPIMGVSDNSSTMWFKVYFDIKPTMDSSWENGSTSRYILVVKEHDGNWYIDELDTLA